MDRTGIINRIARQIRARPYLEIGGQGGVNFGRVRGPTRVGVDPDPGSGGTIHLPSDAYFARLDSERSDPDKPDTTFDLVFVDGLHHSDQVLRDIENAVRYLTPGGVIVVHDCDPPTEGSATRVQSGGVWCGDVYRGWLRYRATSKRETFTVDADLGCGIVLDSPCLASSLEGYPLADLDSLPWPTFRARRSELLGLVTIEVFEQRIQKLGEVGSAQ